MKHLAFSYMRFSNPEQAKGDSIRRQEARRKGWLDRHPDVTLDKTLVARGKSALHGKHRSDTEVLGEFLQLVKDGAVPRGSYLIVESLDRLTREEIQPALMLILGLLQAGIRIVQLVPVEMIYTDKSGPNDIMLMIVELMRGHSESKTKSERVGDAWSEKKRQHKVDGKPYTANTYAWLQLVGEVRGGRKVDYSNARYVLKPGAERTIKRVFRMCIEGYGVREIARKLNEDGTARFGKREWSGKYVRKILHSRETIGIVGEAQFYDAEQAMRHRRKFSGRPGKASFNPFRGIVHDALNGCPMYAVERIKRRWLVSRAAINRKVPWRQFPVEAFEEALRDELGKLQAADFDTPQPRADEIARGIIDTKALLERARERWNASKGSATWADEIDRLEGRLTQQEKELDAERWKAASPASSALANVKQKDPRKFGAVLRRAVERIDCVIVTRKHDRVCAAQVRLKDSGKVLSYYIRWWPAKSGCVPGRKARWECYMHPDAGSLDFRKKADAEVLYSLFDE